MQQDRLVLNDGTTILNGIASKTSLNDRLLIEVPGGDLVQLAYTFSSPERTQTIVCYNGVYKHTYTGYTDMYSVQFFETDNYVQIWLKPPANGHVSYNRELTVPEIYMSIAYTNEPVPEETTEEVTEAPTEETTEEVTEETTETPTEETTEEVTETPTEEEANTDAGESDNVTED